MVYNMYEIKDYERFMAEAKKNLNNIEEDIKINERIQIQLTLKLDETKNRIELYKKKLNEANVLEMTDSEIELIKRIRNNVEYNDDVIVVTQEKRDGTPIWIDYFYE